MNKRLCLVSVGTGAVPFSIGCYAVYTNLDKLWQQPHFRFSSLQNFINGCLAAGVAQTLSFPFETVKRKMQVWKHFYNSWCRFNFLMCVSHVNFAI